MKTPENAAEEYKAFPEPYGRRKLGELYRAIPLKDTTSRTLRKYFDAMANLYGIIPLEKVFEIISKLSPRTVSKEEFLAFAEIAKHEDSGYYILGKCDLYYDGPQTSLMEYEIIDVSLLGEDLDEYHETLRSQQGKPYYIPPKTQLLAHADVCYCENTPESKALQDFLLNRLKLDKDKAEAAFDEMCFSVRYMDDSFSKQMENLTAMGARLTQKNAERFMELHQSFHNHARMQCNRGYTPNELFEMAPPEDRIPKAISFGPNIRNAIMNGEMDANDLRKQIMSMDMPSEELRRSFLQELASISGADAKPQKQIKVGRNEPCPCGSGKKYKHCCGR